MILVLFSNIKNIMADTTAVIHPKINGALELTCVHSKPAKNDAKNAQKPIVV